MNDEQQSAQEPEVSPEIKAAFERVRIARQAKIDRYRKPKTEVRKPYKEEHDTDA